MKLFWGLPDHGMAKNANFIINMVLQTSCWLFAMAIFLANEIKMFDTKVVCPWERSPHNHRIKNSYDSVSTLFFSQIALAKLERVPWQLKKNK